MRCTASTPTFDVVTVICSNAIWPCVSVAVAVQVPTASPVMVSATVGPLAVLGLMVATLAQAVAAMLKAPV